MGVYAETTGEITVRDCPETQAVLNKLREMAEEVEAGLDAVTVAENRKARILDISVRFRAYCGYSFAVSIDTTIKKLGPFAVKGAQFTSKGDGETGYFVVGSERQKKQVASQCAYGEIMVQSSNLLLKDINRVIEHLQKLKKGKKPNGRTKSNSDT